MGSPCLVSLGCLWLVLLPFCLLFAGGKALAGALGLEGALFF